MRKITRRAGRLGSRFIQDGAHAVTTVHARLPMLMTPQPSISETFERNRMVAEKVDAAARGVLEASFAMGSFWFKAMTGGVRGPADVVAGMLDVAAAATAPASRKVAANARRLRKK